MELVQVAGVSREAAGVLDSKRGRAETGRSCLLFRSGSPDDSILLNNSHAAKWSLKRDWRPYDLLLLSIQSPAPDLRLNLTIAAGPEKDRRSVGSSQPLAKGWNLLRFDVANIGEHLPLDDIQELRLAVLGAGKTVEVCLDDIVLTGNREDLFVDSANSAGGLYVRQAGRRWHVGAGGRFELTFANGQIVGWHNLAVDPYRLRNLVQGTTMGPTPVVMDNGEARPFHLSTRQQEVVTDTRLVEANPVRAVITTEWRFTGSSAAVADPSACRWQYTIYRSGQIYVAVEATRGDRAALVPPLGLALNLATGEEDVIQTHAAAGMDVGVASRHAAYASARKREGNAFLLYSVAKPDNSASVEMIQQVDAAHRVVSLIAQAAAEPPPLQRWSCEVWLSSAGEVSDDDALSRAVSFRNPPELTLAIGSIAGSLRPNDNPAPTGFDRESGGYVLTPDQACVRFIVCGRGPAFSPTFQIVDADAREAWVYVDHLIFSAVARDRFGNLLFQLPGTVRAPTLVEVLFRGPEG